MPAYDYFCPECQKEKEVSHGMFEEVEVLCEECQCKMKKMVSGGSGTIFKGSGWFSKGNAPTPKHTKEVGVAVTPGMESTLNQDIQRAIRK